MRERTAASKDILVAYARALSSGSADVTEWMSAVRTELKNAYLQLAALGKGGWDQMTPADWGRVGGDLADQFAYLQRFADEIAVGNLTEGQITTRLGMYAEATKEAYWDTWQSTADVTANPDLPELTQTPGDGQTQCLTNCNCSLSAEADGVHWNLHDGEHCPDCQALAAGGPYRVA